MRHERAPRDAAPRREEAPRGEDAAPSSGGAVPAAYWQHYGIAVQGKADGGGGARGDAALKTASEGVAGAGAPLPHLGAIQRAFGRHDVSGVHAHVGGAAATAAEALGARAYATGSGVAFRAAPDLHTAAHEAAHVVQQRAGVHLKGGVGEAGDAYEQHADAVADAVVAGRSAEALLDARGGGPSVQRLQLMKDDAPGEQPGQVGEIRLINAWVGIQDPKTQRWIYLRYTRASDEEAARGLRFVVYLSAGVDPALRPAIAAKLGATEKEIEFTNERSDGVAQAPSGPSQEVMEKRPFGKDEKIALAKHMVAEYLHSVGLTELDATDVAKLLALQPVEFFDSGGWKLFLLGVPGSGSAEETEGLTKPGGRGQRAVGINQANHTVPAIVHELFHALESGFLQSLPHGLVEGITELFTRRVAGLDVRRSRGGSPIYVDNVRFVELAIARGVVSNRLLVRAYFLGELDPIAPLAEAYLRFSEQQEKVSFATTGNHATAEEKENVWKDAEKFLDGLKAKPAEEEDDGSSRKRKGEDKEEERGSTKKQDREERRLAQIKVGDVIQGTVEELEAIIDSRAVRDWLRGARVGGQVRIGFVWWEVVSIQGEAKDGSSVIRYGLKRLSEN